MIRMLAQQDQGARSKHQPTAATQMPWTADTVFGGCIEHGMPTGAAVEFEQCEDHWFMVGVEQQQEIVVSHLLAMGVEFSQDFAAEKYSQ